MLPSQALALWAAVSPPVGLEGRAGIDERHQRQIADPWHFPTEAAKLLNKQLERGKIDGLKLAG